MTNKRTDARLGEILIGNAGLQSYISPDECEKPGAWRELDLGEHGGAGLIVWRMECDDRSPEQEAAAERLVACWNACQGVPTEKLHQLLPPPEFDADLRDMRATPKTNEHPSVVRDRKERAAFALRQGLGAMWTAAHDTPASDYNIMDMGEALADLLEIRR